MHQDICTLLFLLAVAAAVKAMLAMKEEESIQMARAYDPFLGRASNYEVGLLE
jgi:hypothetical protein